MACRRNAPVAVPVDRSARLLRHALAPAGFASWRKDGTMPGYDENLTAAGRRLLLHLAAAEDAFARASMDDPGHVALYARRGRTTLGAGRVPIAAAERLVAEDLACWERLSRGRRLLVATEAGRARAARLRAGGGAEGFQAQHRDMVETVERPLAGGEARR